MQILLSHCHFFKVPWSRKSSQSEKDLLYRCDFLCRWSKWTKNWYKRTLASGLGLTYTKLPQKFLKNFQIQAQAETLAPGCKKKEDNGTGPISSNH